MQYFWVSKQGRMAKVDQHIGIVEQLSDRSQHHKGIALMMIENPWRERVSANPAAFA